MESQELGSLVQVALTPICREEIDLWSRSISREEKCRTRRQAVQSVRCGLGHIVAGPVTGKVALSLQQTEFTSWVSHLVVEGVCESDPLISGCRRAIFKVLQWVDCIVIIDVDLQADDFVGAIDTKEEAKEVHGADVLDSARDRVWASEALCSVVARSSGDVREVEECR